MAHTNVKLLLSNVVWHLFVEMFLTKAYWFLKYIVITWSCEATLTLCWHGHVNVVSFFMNRFVPGEIYPTYATYQYIYKAGYKRKCPVWNTRNRVMYMRCRLFLLSWVRFQY